MAYRNLLDIVQRASKRLLLPVPSTVVGNSDTGIQQMLELIQEESDDSLSDHDWTALTTSLTITSTGVNYTTITLPSDYDRMLKDNSIIRSLNRVELIGPVSSDEWVKITLYNSSLITGAWRFRNGKLEVYGLATGDTAQTEYQSSNWIYAADGTTAKANWTVDTDTPRIDDTILRLGLVWRWKKAKGLDFNADLDNYITQKEQIISYDRGMRPRSMARSLRGGLPDNFWPGTVVVTP